MYAYIGEDLHHAIRLMTSIETLHLFLAVIGHDYFIHIIIENISSHVKFEIYTPKNMINTFSWNEISIKRVRNLIFTLNTTN